MCAYVALFAHRLAYNQYAIAHAYNAANAHAQGSGVEAKKVNSLVEGNRSIVSEIQAVKVLEENRNKGHFILLFGCIS